jgi:hypothetical protein
VRVGGDGMIMIADSQFAPLAVRPLARYATAQTIHVAAAILSAESGRMLDALVTRLGEGAA